MKIRFYKTRHNAITPEFKTEGSACFDLAYCGKGVDEVKGFNQYNTELKREITNENLYIGPNERIMVPTGLILDIPTGYSVRIHARSGTSLKHGLVMVNAEGVIDSDYVEELFLLVHNIGANGVVLHHGERIAQGELVKSVKTILVETNERPMQKTSRNGGMGSTGQ